MMLCGISQIILCGIKMIELLLLCIQIYLLVGLFFAFLVSLFIACLTLEFSLTIDALGSPELKSKWENEKKLFVFDILSKIILMWPVLLVLIYLEARDRNADDGD